MTRADKLVWLMKCPSIVTRFWQAASVATGSSGSSDPTQNLIIAKVVLSLDLLNSDESSFMQVQSSSDESSSPQVSLFTTEQK
jgi:transcription initiation factor TFIIF subunit beta